MKKIIPVILILLIASAAFAAGSEHKVVFAYFSGYRCAPCMQFEDTFLNNFKETYKDKYKGRVELKIYKIDIPLYLTPSSPEYAKAQKLAKRNADILKATGKMNSVQWIGAIPYGVIGKTSLDSFSKDTQLTTPNVERAIEQALRNNETTRLADSVSGKMQDYTDIEEAVKAGDYKAVEAFLNSGAKPTGGLLSIAAFNGDRDIIELLLSRDASIINEPAEYGDTAIGNAAFMGRTELVDFLLSKDAKLPPDIIISAGIDENMIILLKKHGADINAARKDGHTALTNVIVNREKMSGVKIAIKYAEILIRQGADVNMPVTIKDEKGNTITKKPLQLASSEEMRTFLISHNAK